MRIAARRRHAEAQHAVVDPVASQLEPVQRIVLAYPPRRRRTLRGELGHRPLDVAGAEVKQRQPPRAGRRPRRPLLDLSSGYVQRSVADFPAQGPAAPWRVRQNYPLDRLELRRHRIDDGVLRFGTVPAPDDGKPADVCPATAGA